MDIVLLALLEQRLPTDSLVAEEYGLNITLEKIQCLEDCEWLNSEAITFWRKWWCELIGAGTEEHTPQPQGGSQHLLLCQIDVRLWLLQRQCWQVDLALGHLHFRKKSES